MICDHISGDACDNQSFNLRILCPLCDTLRHSGLAGIKKTLTVRASKLSQLEIVKRTQEFFLKNGRCPRAREIDPLSRATKLLPIDVATQEGEEIPGE